MGGITNRRVLQTGKGILRGVNTLASIGELPTSGEPHNCYYAINNVIAPAWARKRFGLNVSHWDFVCLLLVFSGS